MKKNRNIKRLIKKRIEILNGEKKIIKSNVEKQQKKIVKTKSNKPKLISTPSIKPKRTIKIIDKNAIEKKNLATPKNLNKHEARLFKKIGKEITPKNKTFPKYVRDYDVDFDVIICISSYNRYSKVKRILEQLYSQDSKYKFKIILMNDGSSGTVYNRFKKQFSELHYLENNVNGGKRMYWKTLSDLWGEVKNYNTNALCQLDDDFILSSSFIDNLMNTYYSIKEMDNSYTAFHFHTYDFSVDNVKHTISDVWWNDKENKSIDGGTLYDIKFIKDINYSIRKKIIKSNSSASGVWSTIGENLIKYGGYVYRFKNSIVLHDGNEDSKLNPLIRRTKKMITKNFKK